MSRLNIEIVSQVLQLSEEKWEQDPDYEKSHSFDE